MVALSLRSPPAHFRVEVSRHKCPLGHKHVTLTTLGVGEHALVEAAHGKATMYSVEVGGGGGVNGSSGGLARPDHPCWFWMWVAIDAAANSAPHTTPQS